MGREIRVSPSPLEWDANSPRGRRGQSLLDQELRGLVPADEVPTALD
jgi:hypothetical protein